MKLFGFDLKKKKKTNIYIYIYIYAFTNHIRELNVNIHIYLVDSGVGDNNTEYNNIFSTIIILSMVFVVFVHEPPNPMPVTVYDFFFIV